jgi:GNAT superfamily N-acetyltransferase
MTRAVEKKGHDKETAAMGVRVREVASPADLRQFIDLPWDIYGRDPNWVPPLKADVRARLDFARHPFWEHARGALFLAERQGRAIGRISAQVDDNYNSLWNEKLGSFGFFECVDDQETADALFGAAARWAARQGMTTLRGPMSPSSNDEWAFLIEGFERPPVLMMPYNPRYYPTLAERHGFAKAKDLLAFYKHASTPMPDRMIELARKLRANARLSLRPVNLKDLKNEMVIIKEIYNESWQRNWGFSPMTEKEMDLMAHDLKSVADPNMVLLAFYDGKPAGLAITLPDLNDVIRRLNGELGPLGLLKYLYYRRQVKGSRAFVFGVKQPYRRLGLPILLFYETEQYMRRRGYEWCELSWNLEDNRLINDFDRELGAEIYKRYRVYEKAL